MITQINLDMSQILFRDGYMQTKNVSYLEVTFEEYMVKQLCAHTFMRDFLDAQAFSFMGAPSNAFSTLSFLHLLCGWGSEEERTNTRPREFDPFLKPRWVRVQSGLQTLPERIAEEIASLGGEVRLSCGVSSIIGEPIPEIGR